MGKTNVGLGNGKTTWKNIQNHAAILTESLFNIIVQACIVSGQFRNETCLGVIVIRYLIFSLIEWRHTSFKTRDWAGRKRSRESEDLSYWMSDDGLL